MTGHPRQTKARGIGDGAQVSLSSRPTGICADGMVDMCRWHGDFAMRIYQAAIRFSFRLL